MNTVSNEVDRLTKPLEAVVVRVREDGKIVTDSVTLHEEFGRRHDKVMESLRSLIGDRTLNLPDFREIEYMDGRGRKQPCIELTERGALIAMPFIGGVKSRQGQVRLVDAFTAMRDELRRVKAEKPTALALVHPDFTDPAASAEAWAQQFRARLAAESERNQLRIERSKDSEFVAKYVDADGLLGIRESCMALDIENERDFTDFLENALRCMYRIHGGKLVPRAQHRHAGRFKVKTGINHATNRAYTDARVTTKGLTYLAREWAEYNLDRAAYIALHAPKDGDVDEEVLDATRETDERRAARDGK